MERHHAIVAAGLAIGISQGSLEGVEYDGADDSEGWAEAVRTSPPDTFEQVVATVGWRRSLSGLDQQMRQAGEAAVAIADRLGAEPLVTELRHHLHRLAGWVRRHSWP